MVLQYYPPSFRCYVVLITNFMPRAELNYIAPVHVGFVADVGYGNATQELILLRVSVVPADLKQTRLISRYRARCKRLKRG
jgi:hypothetical protein